MTSIVSSSHFRWLCCGFCLCCRPQLNSILMKSISSFILLALSVFTTLSFAQDNRNPLEGRWDVVITRDGKDVPSWLEIKHSGTHTLVGRFVGPGGSARPISEVKVNEGKFSFAIPPQWEKGNTNLEFVGQLDGENLKGTIVSTDGKTYSWTASRAPLLKHDMNPKWGKPITLFNGKDLTGWHATGENQWIAEGGILK